MIRALHRTVLRTRGVPGLAALYRGGYEGAVSLSARALHALKGSAGVYLHRGLSRADWSPGISDIDLILMRDGDPLEERGPLDRLANRLRWLRRIFPMLGDVWIGTEAELGHYLRWGGLRVWEDAPSWQLVCGRGMAMPVLSEAAAKKRWLDPWVWAFVGHLEVSRRLFCPGAELPEKRDADLRKSALDSRRYCDFILDDAAALPAPLTRAQARQRWAELERLSPLELWLDSAWRLKEASGLVLGNLAVTGAATTAFPAPGRGSAAAERLNGLLASVPSARCAVSDLPYHTYLLLDDAASQADYAEAAECLLKVPQPGVPLILGRAAWALALQSSYLGAPLGWMDSGAGCASVQGEAAFAGWAACALGQPLERLPVLRQSLRWQAAAEAASWMALWWRALWIGPGWQNRFVLHHLYTRALGLRLLLDGHESGPFCDWELLSARVAARWPEESRLPMLLRRLLLAEPAAALESARREDLTGGHLTLLARLMAGLQEALGRHG